MADIRIVPAQDWEAIGRRWQALEACADGGFFRGWVFLGCQAETRFAGARLLAATEAGQDVALALLGRQRGGVLLNQTGDAGHDSVFIEHNGFLVRRGFAHVVPALLEAALGLAGAVSLAGVDAALLHAAGGVGVVRLRASRFAPVVDLAALDRRYLDTLSANTRAQIRRSQRLFGGDLAIERAESVDDALAFFEELIKLHQARWTRLGHKGAFADATIRAFHAALIARGVPMRAVDMLRVRGGGRVIGYLYQFIANTHVASYQSGFVATSDAREKPGLVSHALAIEFYAREGFAAYDFLGGGDRYKISLARTGEMLHWATLYARGSVRGVLEPVRKVVASGSFLKKRTKKLLSV